MKKTFNFLASIKLSIVLMLYGAVLVFVGTLEQTSIGIEAVQAKYFESWGFLAYDKVPMLGGFIVGLLLFVNLLCSLIKYAKFSVRGVAFVVAHSSLLMLVLAGFMQYFLREQATLILATNETKSSLAVYEKGSSFPKESIDIDFSVRLIEFKAQTWDSSNIHKEFSSLVEIDKDGQKAQYLISMNKPLTFGGWTFYQNSYNKDGMGRTMTILGAVKNPFKELPWISVMLVFFSMSVLYIQKLVSKKGK